MVALAVRPALAWNAAGHRLSAAIAWQALSPAARERIDEMLAAHPDVGRWRERVRDPWPGALLAEAATWPDDLRRAARERSAPDDGAADDEAVHRDWHYLDWPLDAAIGQARGGQLDRQLAALPAQVADAARPAAERAVALAWLVHLVGDAHAPLHAATWRDQQGRWTAGGNGVAVLDPANARRPETNLHRFWDDLPGPPWLRGQRLLAQAEELRRRWPAARVAQASPAAWIEHSHRLADEIARGEDAAAGTIGEDYRQRARAIADRQIAAAGVRLGRLLEALLARRDARLATPP